MPILIFISRNYFELLIVSISLIFINGIEGNYFEKDILYLSYFELLIEIMIHNSKM